MGGFAGGFLSGFTGAAQKKIDEKHAEDEQRKAELRNGLWKIAYDTTGAYNDATKQNAQEQLNKLYGPDGKKGLKKVSDIFGKLMHGGQQQGQQPASGTQPSPRSTLPVPQGAQQQNTDDPGAPGQALASPLGVQSGAGTPPAGQARSNLPSPPPVQQRQQPQSGVSLPPVPTLADEEARQQRAREQREQEETFKTDQAIRLAKSKEKPSALDQMVDALKAANPDLPDDEIKKEAGKIIEDQQKKKGAATSANMQAILMKYPGDGEMDPPHAVRIDPKDPSRKLDQDTGKPVPEGATSIDKETFTAKIRAEGYSNAAKYATAFKKANPGMSDEEASQKGGDLALQEADRRIALIGAGKITEAYGIGGTRTQVVPAGGGPSAPGQPQGQPGAPKPATQTQQPGSSPAGAASAKPATPPQGGKAQLSPGVTEKPGEIILPGMSISQFTQAGARFAPVGAAITEIYGDPAQPNLHPLASYSKLADSKEAQDRIGTAIQLTLDNFGEGIKDVTGEIGVGPVNISAGAFGTWLSNELNLPALASSAKAKQLRHVIGKMTDEEKESYNSTMATMSVMAGLRSISKNSAALGSISMIERELPKIGINVKNTRDFYDQLQRTAGAISNYANTPGLFPLVHDPKTGRVIRAGTSPELMERVSGLTTEMQRKKDAAGVSPRSKLPTPADMEQREYNGHTYQRRKGSSDEWKLVKEAA